MWGYAQSLSVMIFQGVLVISHQLIAKQPAGSAMGVEAHLNCGSVYHSSGLTQVSRIDTHMWQIVKPASLPSLQRFCPETLTAVQMDSCSSLNRGNWYDGLGIKLCVCFQQLWDG